MFTEENVKPVAALAALALPWDVFAYGGNLGWGVSFLYGRVVDTAFGPWVASPVQLLFTYGRVDGGQTGLLVAGGWTVSAVVATLGVALAVHGRLRGATPRRDRLVGLALGGAGVLFVLTRVAGNGRLVWTALPVGAVYALAVGHLFYHDRFGAWLAFLAPSSDDAGQAEPRW